MTAEPDRRTIFDQATVLAFVAMVFGIGGNVVAVKYITRDGQLHPLWAAASRFLLATAIFVVIARVARAPFPRGRALLGAALYGALSIGGFFAFAYWGLERAPVGMAGVLFATNPLITFLLALAHRAERFRWDSVAGSAVVMAGTAVVLGAGVDEGVPILSLLAIVGSSICAAEGAIVVKTFPPVHPAMRNAVGMATGTGLLFALMPVFDGVFAIPSAGSTWAAQAYLVTFGSVGVFGLYLWILGRWPASAVAYEFVAAPVVAIAFAAWLFDERISAGFGVGAVLVLIGVYFGAIRPARAEAAHT